MAEYAPAPTSSDGILLPGSQVCLRCGCLVWNTKRHDEVCQ